MTIHTSLNVPHVSTRVDRWPGKGNRWPQCPATPTNNKGFRRFTCKSRRCLGQIFAERSERDQRETQLETSVKTSLRLCRCHVIYVIYVIVMCSYAFLSPVSPEPLAKRRIFKPLFFLLNALEKQGSFRTSLCFFQEKNSTIQLQLQVASSSPAPYCWWRCFGTGLPSLVRRVSPTSPNAPIPGTARM